MKTQSKILLVGALAVAVIGAVTLQQVNVDPKSSPEDPAGITGLATAADSATTAVPVASAKLPRLLDLGAGKCIPCKLMAPILEELRKEYAGRMDVVFIDGWGNPDEGKKYGIEMIPTPIFYDAEGKELFRHVGFYGKEDILAKWKELGVDVSGKSSAAAN